MRKFLKLMKFVGFFSRGRWEWTWAPFRVDFGTILGAVGTQNRKKGDPETLAKSNGKNMTRAFPTKGEGRPLKLVFSILQRILIDIRHSTSCHKGTVADMDLYTHVRMMLHIHICPFQSQLIVVAGRGRICTGHVCASTLCRHGWLL